jgi:hypothetical protein
VAQGGNGPGHPRICDPWVMDWLLVRHLRPKPYLDCHFPLFARIIMRDGQCSALGDDDGPVGLGWAGEQRAIRTLVILITGEV